MEIELLFNVANISYLIGTLLLARKVIKNRDSLKDFDFYGSVLNTVGMIASAMVLMILKLNITFILSIPTLLFWAMASVYSFKNFKNKK